MLLSTRSSRSRGVLLLGALAAAAGILHADDFWNRKPRSEWSLKESLKLLEDSPWARQEVRALTQSGAPDISNDRSRTQCDVDTLDPVGNCFPPRVRARSDYSRDNPLDSAGSDGLVFLVRWESSAPVEDAFARLVELGEHATAQYLSIPPRFPADRYVITLKAFERSSLIGGSPRSIPFDAIGSLENEASEPRARLTVGSLTVAPLESEHSGVGASEAAHFYFPRQVNGAPLFPPDRAARATFEFRGQRFSIKTHFNINPGILR